MKDGKSWKTTVAGIITFIGGLGVLVSQFGLENTEIGKKVMAVSIAISALGAAFGLVKAKDSNVTGAGNNAITVHKTSDEK